MALFDSINQLNEQRRGIGRRRFIICSLAAVGGYFGFRWWRDRPRPVAQRKTDYITPNQKFYSVSVDPGFSPSVTRGQWQLKVSGLEGRGYALGYDEMLALERRRIYKTFMCVGNEVGGPAMGNAEWTVTPLAPLVARVLGAKRDGLRVVFHALDGFYSSVPLEVALGDQAFVAYEMNRVTLPLAHGFPARVLLPGKYGMKQPRWLSRIEVTDRSETGYWEKRGWSDHCEVKMTARIDAALPRPDGTWLVTGLAYCGAQPVGGVELSVDGGAHWQAAILTTDLLPNAWALWEFIWRPVAAGTHTLAARVIDAAGGRQIESYTGNFPSGATGLHRVTVQV